MTTLRLATPADDGAIRALLRDNGMPSWVEMAIEREPSTTVPSSSSSIGTMESPVRAFTCLRPGVRLNGTYGSQAVPKTRSTRGSQPARVSAR